MSTLQQLADQFQQLPNLLSNPSQGTTQNLRIQEVDDLVKYAESLKEREKNRRRKQSLWFGGFGVGMLTTAAVLLFEPLARLANLDVDVWLRFGITGLVALAMYTLAQLRREPLQELSTRIEALQKRMKLPKIAQKVKGLYKSRKDKIVGGVAAGLAEKLEVSPGLLRLLLLVLIPVTSGAVVFIYFLLAIFLPFAPNQDKL